MGSPVDELIARARAFRSESFVQRQALYQRLAREGQSPKTLMISCSDSRVDPSAIFDTEPGEIFMVRNVASLVPPYTPDAHCHGTSAALEFGVVGLGVAHVIVLGHSHCGGIDVLLRGADEGEQTTDFIGSWLSCANRVRDQVVTDMLDATYAEKARALEYEAVRQSIRNLRTFPWIDERVRQGELWLHGWHFDIATGALCAVAETGGPGQVSWLSGP
ncbi:MAG: carbonic anhydrase [Candidatus Tectomicrobia bacterium]|nr:carbonic anhydrase [Candidatus Tectomicrobia bacterium]